MKTREQFWLRVDAILDARGEPRRDRRVRAWLRPHPEDERELERLAASLGSLARGAPARAVRTGHTRLRVALAAAAFVVAPAIYFLLVPRRAVESGRPVPIDARANPPLPWIDVADWQVEVVTESAAGRRSTRLRDGRLDRDERTSARLTISSAIAFEYGVQTERPVPR